mmetsp:Transcript_128102/g.208740  ORF Transcript_128102/g.208740 Transcript_128102/m.208740 type:complete len:410 (+) Transcript_128102:92-1321(+)
MPTKSATCSADAALLNGSGITAGGQPGPSSVSEEVCLTALIDAMASAGASLESEENGEVSEQVVAKVAEQQRAARLAEPELMVAAGDGAVFRPFRFPTKISEAFRLPWNDIGIVTDRQLESFYNGTQMRGTPKRVIGAVIYLHHHYLLPFKQKIISRGRNLLVIKINEGSGRQPTRRCLAWWMPLAEVRERYADPTATERYPRGGSVYRVCQLVETYRLTASVPVHFEVGERASLGVGGFPLHCFDADPDFQTQWRLGASPEELLEEQREIAQCLETRTPLEMTAEAKKAEKRRRKRQNRKARDKERAAEELQAAQEAAGKERIADEEQRRQGLVKPSAALRDSSFMDGLLEQMRQKRTGAASEKLCNEAGAGAARSDSDAEGSNGSSSSDPEAVARSLRVGPASAASR